MNLKKAYICFVITILIMFLKEEDLLDLLEQCEIDDEKLMGKPTRTRGPKVRCHFLP